MVYKTLTLQTSCITLRSSMHFSDWPTQSPNLHPIENLWQITSIKCNLAKRPVARNVVKLEHQVQEEWQGIPLETVQALVDSMPHELHRLFLHMVDILTVSLGMGSLLFFCDLVFFSSLKWKQLLL